MTVYVDDMRAPFGRMILCHMVADTLDELLVMADTIGVARRWLQHPDDPIAVHFDISLSRRALAVRAGAVEVTLHDVGQRQMALRHGVTWSPGAGEA